MFKTVWCLFSKYKIVRLLLGLNKKYAYNDAFTRIMIQLINATAIKAASYPTNTFMIITALQPCHVWFRLVLFQDIKFCKGMGYIQN